MNKKQLKEQIIVPVIVPVVIALITAVLTYQLTPLLDRKYITGEIYWDEKPEAGLEVSLSNENREIAVTTTNRSGKFKFNNPTSGTYYITFASEKLPYKNSHAFREKTLEEEEPVPVPIFHKISVSESDSLHIPINLKRVGILTFVTPLNKPYVTTVDGKRIVDVKLEGGVINAEDSIGITEVGLEPMYMTSTIAVLHGMHEYSIMMADNQEDVNYLEIESGVFNIQADDFHYAKGISLNSVNVQDANENIIFYLTFRSFGFKGRVLDSLVSISNKTLGEPIELDEYISNAKVKVLHDNEEIVTQTSVPMNLLDFKKYEYEITFSVVSPDPAISDTYSLTVLNSAERTTL